MAEANDQPPRPLVSRRRLVTDGILAGALAVVLSVATVFAGRYHHGYRPVDTGAIALVAGSAAVLAARRRYPVQVLAAVFAATLTYFLLGYPNGPIWLPLIIAYYTAVACGHRLAAGVAAVAGFAIFPWLDYLLRHQPAPSAVSVAAVAAWLLVVLGAGEAMRVRRERAAQAARIKAEEEQRRAGEQRLRIAQDLHDSLGHYLSLISVQSGVALNLNQQLPSQARDALAAVKQASKEGLSELRSVLDILRQDGEPAPRSPAAALSRLGDLIAQASAAGLAVRTETQGSPRPLPFGVDVTAYRIVQEALTNIRRHAGAATATVRLDYGDRELTVQVDDDGRGPAAGPAGGEGQGIAGMRQRVAALGGDFQAGPRPGGGFRVEARLPLEAAR
jgi:signal transduction histidine kinase